MRAVLPALAAAALLAPAVRADDVPEYRQPSASVGVIHSLLPTFRPVGTGHVRLVYDAQGTAARLGVDELYAYEEAYTRALTSLAMSMAIDRAEPLARQAAWNAVVGPNPVVQGTIRPIR